MDMPVQFTFESSQFPPESGEDEETNPGIHGKALAAWLSEQLIQRGYRIKRTIAEDFGRLIQLEDPHFHLYVACASTNDTAKEWIVHSFAEFGWLASLLRRRNKRAVVTKVMADLKAILEASPSIRNLREA
jgi:hypothetical protein